MLSMIEHVRTNMAPVYMSELILDLDPLAERIIIMDRSTANVLYSGKSAPSLIFHFDKRYSELNDIVVIMFDNQREFNAEIGDGVVVSLVEVISAGL
ncbi:hypothetical protein L5M36_02935 [Shewanella sp. SM72]|uniref:hypothetical protein n=1 Tax=Shewanella TaxID=22 RepID=UPI000DE81E90|nr:hypothetical protein [Shewanella sp. SM72]MCU8015852.1 hypothetical protein [Shewanella sp. SM72]RBP80988.1 hypothetical protein DET47_104283 [Shewanella putrefaciens]